MDIKERYSSPECETIDLKVEGVICASVDPSLDPTFNNPFNPEQNW